MEDLELNSRAVFLWNNSGMFEVWGRAADQPVEVASLTKIMTAMVVLKVRKLSDEVVITPEMLTGLEEFAVIGLEVGQTATVEDLLYALMLPSAGDAAQALAISTSGSIEDFVGEMNTLATKFGMTNTHFSNPVGFDAGVSANGATGKLEGETRNYSTAQDVAIMLGRALEDSHFREIFGSYEKDLPSIGKVARKTFAEADVTNLLTGGKTGFTNAAGRCLASTAEIEGSEYILVTLGADNNGHLEDATKIYTAVGTAYEPVKLVSASDTIVRIGVERSPMKMLEFQVPHDVVVALPNDVRAEDLTYRFEGYRGVTTVSDRELSSMVNQPFGSWIVEYQGKQVAGRELTLYDECTSVDCVRMPGFYNYGWMVLGALVTLCLIGLTVREFWKRRKHQPEGKAQKAAPWLGLAMSVIGLMVCAYVYWDCFSPAPELEVIQHELQPISEEGATSMVDEESPSEGETNEVTEANIEELPSGNCTTSLGNLMLINPNFTVGNDFIAARGQQLISVSQNYGISEYHPQGNGDNLMIPEAAEHLNEMLAAYRAANPGHEMGTYSCFRRVGTQCGRLCAATGASDHHTGLTCDLIDLAYGSVLDTDDYPDHLEWQWLRENSYKYGFIDRFPEEWAGGLMSEPLNVDENGSTGLFETWHYRYVGVIVATEIATGKYNNGRYDSLEHYLKMTGKVADLKGGKCF